jgi:hypothetical protein
MLCVITYQYVDLYCIRQIWNVYINYSSYYSIIDEGLFDQEMMDWFLAIKCAKLKYLLKKCDVKTTEEEVK